MRKSDKAMITGQPVLKGYGAKPGNWLLYLLPLFSFWFSLAMIYLGMRGIMRLGGFVATGGPYEIAHPAPNWVWIFPVFINVMVIAMISSAAVSKKISGPNLMALSWSALFMSLGWNFTEFGFGINSPAGVSIAWVICALLFMAMGGIPLIVLLYKFFKELQEHLSKSEYDYTEISWMGTFAIQVIVAACGFYLGSVLFNSL